MKFGCALIGVMASIGCTPDDDLVTVNEAEAMDNLALFEEQGPTDYAYVMKRTCHCANTDEWVRIVVEDGVVLSALTAAGDETESGSAMSDVLQGLVDWTRRDPLVFEAAYDPELGYLVHLELDISTADDDEYELTVDCLGEGTADDVCPLEPAVAEP